MTSSFSNPLRLMPRRGVSSSRPSSAKQDLLFVLVEHFDRQAEALQLLHQYLERFRNAGFEYVVALDDGFVGLDAADYVVAT